jgi:hypothetical protein
MKKVLLVIAGVLLLTGCAKGDLKAGYENMQIAENKINGYQLDLRITGNYNDQSISENVRITNYQNKNYEIVISNNNKSDSSSKSWHFSSNNKKDIIYIKDGSVYTADENGTYVLSSTPVKYANPAIYLEGLKYIKETSGSTTEKIGDKSYKKYNVTVDKKIINEIIKDATLKDGKVADNIAAEIYLDNEKTVYQIIYHIDDMVINASYFNVNAVSEIAFPNGI